jgi:hypothetical protein
MILNRTTFILSLALFPLAGHAGQASAGSGGAVSQTQHLSTLQGLPYAVVRLATGQESPEYRVLRLNNSNQVLIGNGFVWGSGNLIQLQGAACEPVDMNDAGVIIGKRLTGDGVNRPVVWINPTAQPNSLIVKTPHTVEEMDDGLYACNAYIIDNAGAIHGDLGYVLTANWFAFSADIKWASSTAEPSILSSSLWPTNGAWYPIMDPMLCDWTERRKTSGGGSIALQTKLRATMGVGGVEGNDIYSSEDYIEFAGAKYLTDSYYSDINGVTEDHPQYFNPASVNENGRYAGRHSDETEGVYWGENGTSPQLIEGGAVSAVVVNNQNDILTLSGLGVHKVWSWLPTESGDFEYKSSGIDLGADSTWSVNMTEMNASRIIAGRGTKTSDPQGASYAGPILLVPAELAVDANRDGVITLASDLNPDPALSEKTSKAKPFRFWSNDDYDGDSETSGEVLNTSTKDYETTGLLDTNAIKNIRDLEDFARLWIYTQGLNESFKNGSLQLGLKWTNVTGTPKINLYKAYEADGGDQYLKNPAIAAEQIQNEYDNPIESVGGQTTVAPGPTFVFEKEVFANLSEAQPKTFFIFEGAGEGKGQLKMVILKDGVEIGEGPGVWFDLVNVKSMYERAVATATFSEPWNYAQTGNLPAFSVSVAADPQGHAFQQPVGETKESLVFVHGWKMDAADVRSFSETMFKRLWWEGFKGRFRVFRWPTYTGYYSFSDSEFMAWKCGSSLKSYIEGSVPGASLPSDYTKCLAAHSLGNVVAGSALKQGLVPDRYFVMQGAIPSGCYDTSDTVNGFANPASASSAFDAVPSIVVLRSMFSGGETGKSTPDNDSPDWGYRGSLVGASAGKVVNFCNPRDFALTTGAFFNEDTNWLAWQFSYKPRDRTISGDINFEYRYTPTAIEGQRLKLYRYTDSAHDTVSAERLLADAHESMGFLARTRSLPIGADTQAGGIVDTTVNLQATYGFTDSRGDHSGQFMRTIHSVSPFYKRIVQELE